MEDLGIVIALFTLFGAPLASWVIINRKITKLETENLAMEKQFTSLELSYEKEFTRLEDDYKERFDVVKDNQEKYEQNMSKTLNSLFDKMEDNKNDILTKIEGVTKEITDLKIKIQSRDSN